MQIDQTQYVFLSSSKMWDKIVGTKALKHAENVHKTQVFVASSAVNDATCYSKVEKTPVKEPFSQSAYLRMESVMMWEPHMHLFLSQTKEMEKRVRAKQTVLLHGLNHLLERLLCKWRIN